MAFRRAVALAIGLALTLAGCGTATTTPAPTLIASPVASPAPPVIASSAPEPWPEVDVAQPAAVNDAPTLQPGFQCHPCHFLAENQFFGIGQSAAGPIAVGVQEPPAQAIAYSAPDGIHWQPLPGFVGASGTTAIAAASNGARSVIVGLDSSGATAWASPDGTAWTQAPKQADLLVQYAAGGMTAVTPFGNGFVAGGYRDDPLHVAASAAVWRSTDGLTWTADDAAPFAKGRIWGVAAKGDTLVAVGTTGDPNYGPAAAWRWTQARGWQRSDIGPVTDGAMKAVVATASGFVAVGLNGTDNGARVWTSADGLTWTAVADQPAFHYFSLPLRMQSVVVGPAGLVAGGWRSDAGKGSAVTWTSKDGLTWSDPVWEPSFSGGQVTGLAVSGGAVVAVGRTGYPDWNTAAIWQSPAP